MKKSIIFVGIIILVFSMFLVNGASYPEPFPEPPLAIIINHGPLPNSIAAASIASNLNAISAGSTTTISTPTIYPNPYEEEKMWSEKRLVRLIEKNNEEVLIEQGEVLFIGDSKESNSQYDNYCNKDDFLKLIGRVNLLEKELTALKLELNQSKDQIKEFDLNFSTEMKQVKREQKQSKIANFFMKIFN